MRTRIFLGFVAFALLASTGPVTAQETDPLPPDVLDALGTTLDGIIAEEPNRAWDGLGLFSDDALRIIESATSDIEVLTYAFGDDPNGTPSFVPAGGTPVGIGSLFFHLPDDWTPPAEGLGDSMAFAQTVGAKVGAGDTVMMFWGEMDSDFDFSSERFFSEGFPLMLPGYPVWNSTFAGDTWEGANVIPNAIYQDGVLTLDVKIYEPPQSFPLIDLAAFYYRSGNVMAMAVSVEGLVALLDAGENADAASYSNGTDQNLLYRGGAQDQEMQGSGSAGDLALRQRENLAIGIFFGEWLHDADSPISRDGFIAVTAGLKQNARFAFGVVANILLSRASEPEEPTPDPQPAVTPEPEPTPDDSPAAVAETDEEPATNPAPATTSTTDGGGGSSGFVIVPLGAIALIIFGLWLAFVGLRRRQAG